MTKKRGGGTVRSNTKTTISLAPLSVNEALGALLKTPPPGRSDESLKAKKKNKRK
jgi:hypothetical protein